VTQIGTAYLRVVAELDKQGLANAQSGILKWGKRLAAAGVAAEGLQVVAGFLMDSVEAAKESQKVQAQLARTVEASGQSYAKYGKQIDATIAKTSNLAGIDDEELAQSFTKLEGSTKDVGKALDGMALAADIAKGRGISLEAATKAVEKSMTGQANAFKRIGVNLPKVTKAYDELKGQVNDLQDAQKGASKSEKAALQSRIDSIKSAYEAAKASDKQATAANELAEAQKRFGGAAEAYGKTAAGAQERFGVALENVKEQIGTALLPLLTKFFDAATKGLMWWQANWPKISDTIAQVARVAKIALDPLIAQVKLVADVVIDVARLINAIAHGEWGKAWQALKQLVVDVFRDMLNYIESLPLVRAIKALATKAVEGIDALVQAVKGAANRVGQAIVDGIEGYLNFYVKLGQAILSQIKQAATWVVQNFGTPFAALVELIASRIVSAVDFGVELGRKLLNEVKAAAQWLLDHIVNPFAGLGDKLWNAFKDGVGDLAGKIKDYFAGLVPHKVFGVSIPNPFSIVGAAVPATAYPAVVAGAGTAAAATTTGMLRASSTSSTLGSGTGTRALQVPGLGQQTTTINVPPIEVRVFIGDEELRGIVRTEVGRSDTGIARTLLAGGPV
jgi:hypothetical protein